LALGIDARRIKVFWVWGLLLKVNFMVRTGGVHFVTSLEALFEWGKEKYFSAPKLL